MVYLIKRMKSLEFYSASMITMKKEKKIHGCILIEIQSSCMTKNKNLEITSSCKQTVTKQLRTNVSILQLTTWSSNRIRIKITLWSIKSSKTLPGQISTRKLKNKLKPTKSHRKWYLTSMMRGISQCTKIITRFSILSPGINQIHISNQYTNINNILKLCQLITQFRLIINQTNSWLMKISCW
jgi:hypothetical protein